MFLQETCPASFKIHQSTRFITGNKANPYWAKCDSSFLKSLLSTDSFALSVFLQVLLVVHTLRWSLWELVIFRMLIQVHGIQVLWPEFLHSNQVPRWCWRCGSMDHTLSSRDLYGNRVLLLQRCGFSIFVLLFGIKKKKIQLPNSRILSLWRQKKICLPHFPHKGYILSWEIFYFWWLLPIDLLTICFSGCQLSSGFNSNSSDCAENVTCDPAPVLSVAMSAAPPSSLSCFQHLQDPFLFLWGFGGSLCLHGCSVSL